MSDEKPEIKTEVAKPKVDRKGFAAIFDVNEDKEVLRLLSIAKSLGGVSSKLIVELGVKAYLQTPDFKKKAEIIKKMAF